MPLSPGDNLGPYEIHAPIGSGGMGEAYRARDTRLGREVAIKTAHEEFSGRFLLQHSILSCPNVLRSDYTESRKGGSS
jgi:serine/threonine protein kinase